ncbi:MAG: hypothetical protein RR285_14985 [Acinetobacter sp.]
MSLFLKALLDNQFGLDDQQYAQRVALVQILPRPNSSQLCEKAIGSTDD